MYSQNGTLEQSISKTFSGEEWCSLCIAIDDSRSSLPENDSSDNIERSLKREFFISPIRDILLFQCYSIMEHHVQTLIWEPQTDLIPPTPPPKQA